MPETVVSGHPVGWRVYGSGPRAAVMLHCSLAHSGAWGALAERLGDALTMTAFDQPGHGRSGDWDGKVDLHRLTTDIAVHFAAQSSGPVDLFGHSFGGTVALRLAIERPDLVRSLTLVEPVLFAAARTSAPGAFAQYEAAKAPFVRALAQGDKPRATAFFHDEWGAGTLDAMAEPQRRYITDRIGMIMGQDHALTGDSAGLLQPGRLASIKVPVLLVEGAASPPVIDAIMAELARHLPQARRLAVPGAGHMVPITHPDTVAAAVRDHLGLAAAHVTA